MDAVRERAHPLSGDETLWRGTKDSRVFTTGERFALKHPESTSLSPNVATNYMVGEGDEVGKGTATLYQIQAPAGTPAMVYGSELQEVALPKGTEVEVVHVVHNFEMRPGKPSSEVRLVALHRRVPRAARRRQPAHYRIAQGTEHNRAYAGSALSREARLFTAATASSLHGHSSTTATGPTFDPTSTTPAIRVHTVELGRGSYVAQAQPG